MLGILRTPSGPFEPPTHLYHLLTRPLHFLVYYAHHLINFLRGQPNRSRDPVRIVCLSDTHTHTLPVPDGDVLIHAGDLSNRGTKPELERTFKWIEEADYEVKIVIAGQS